MNYNEILQKVREIVNGKQENFAKATLNDGETEIITDGEELNTGQKVYILDSEGNRQDVPQGIHNLNDGRTIVVNESGEITDIKEVNPSSGDTTNDNSSSGDTTNEESEELKEIKERVQKLENVLMEAVEKMKQDSESRDKEVEELNKAYEELSKAPASNPSEETTAKETTAKEEFGKEFNELTLSEKIQLNIKNNE